MAKTNMLTTRRSLILQCLTTIAVFLFSMSAGWSLDEETQRPLPLPTNDLPDFSQQLELLRRLRSAMQAREALSAQAANRNNEGTKEEKPANGAQDSKTDPQQLSRLQNALKNLTDRLPKDFVPPSLDAIPKDQLKKAMEDPAVRRSMQEMLRQFSQDGVIPPASPDGPSDMPALPLPPQDETNKNQPETNNDEPDRQNDDPKPSIGETAPIQSKPDDSGTNPTGETEATDEPKQQNESDASAKSDTIPPSSLKSLQDFLKRLEKGTTPNSDPSVRLDNSDAPTPETKDQSRPLRRRDRTTPVPSSKNQSKSTPGRSEDPPKQSATGRQNNATPATENAEQGNNDAPGIPRPGIDYPPTQRMDNNLNRPPGSMPDPESPGIESQQKALQALQDVMQELEREQQQPDSNMNPGSPSDRSNPSNGQPESPSGSGSFDPNMIEMMRRLANPGNASEGNNSAGDDGPQGSGLESLANNMSEEDRSFVREFLRKELERMNSESGGQNSQSDSPADRMNPADALSNSTRQEREQNRSTSPNQPMPNQTVPRSGRTSDKSGIASNQPNRSGSPSQSQNQMNSRPTQRDSQSQPPAPKTGDTGRSDPADMSKTARNQTRPRSANEIEKEIQNRGVVETLKSTWEKSVRESREKRQREIQQELSKDASDSGMMNSSNGMQSQLESLAKQLKDNPNTEKAISDMINRVANDMAEQSNNRGSSSESSSNPLSRISTRSDNSSREIPGQSMLKSIRDSLSDMFSGVESSSVPTPASSGGSSSITMPSLPNAFDFTPVLVLAGILAAVAVGFYTLRAVRHHQAADAALAAAIPPIQPSQIQTRADIVRAFHELATTSARSVQSWWTHRKVQIALARVVPEKQHAVVTLVDAYEQARYLPHEFDLSPDQIQSARSALEAIKS